VSVSWGTGNTSPAARCQAKCLALKVPPPRGSVSGEVSGTEGPRSRGALGSTPHPVLFSLSCLSFIIILVFSHFLDYFILCSLFFVSCAVFPVQGTIEEGGMSAGTTSFFSSSAYTYARSVKSTPPLLIAFLPRSLSFFTGV
jgi:hypothetical protein